MNDALRERIAEALGWKVEDTHSFSLHTLREIVRPVSPKLANELSIVIRDGSYIVGEKHRPRRSAP
jgi:hypothetical protein